MTSVKLATRVTLPPHWSSRNDPLALAFRHGLSAAAGPGRGARCADAGGQPGHPRRGRDPRPGGSPERPRWPTRPLRTAAYTAEAVRASKVPTAPVKPDVREVQLTVRRREQPAGPSRTTSSARVVAAPGGRQHAHHDAPDRSPASVRSASPGRTGVAIPAGSDRGRGPDPHPRHLVGLAHHPLRPGARPRPRLGRGPARPARHRPDAGRQGRPRPGTGGQPAPAAGGHEARGDRPGPRPATPRPSTPRSTPAPWTATTAPTRRLPRRRPASRSPATPPGSPPRSSRPRPVIYSRAAVGRRREDARQVLPALRRRARRLRAPHRQRQRLHAGRGAGAPAQHLRLPRAVPRLERHRLQLPDRPVRPDLGGPVRRRRPRRWSAPTPSATTTTRSPPRRSATTSSPSRARRCSRPTPRSSPGSSRCTASTPPPRASTSPTRWFQAINGHRDAAATACPGQYLYDKLPAIRKMAAADQRGWSGRQLESNLASTPAPDIVVRRASDGEAFVVPTGGLIHFPAGRPPSPRGSAGARASW